MRRDEYINAQTGDILDTLPGRLSFQIEAHFLSRYSNIVETLISMKLLNYPPVKTIDFQWWVVQNDNGYILFNVLS